MNWLSFLLQANFYLLLFYGFYRLMLHYETFYYVNRAYLLATLLLSFFIPFFQSDFVKNWFITQEIQTTFSVVLETNLVVLLKPVSPSFTWFDGIKIVYFFGVFIFTNKFIINLLTINKAFNNSSNKAFSFFNKIQISSNLSNRETILIHELVHVKQVHSADILLLEIVGIFCWFNPIIYLYKESLKHIHEFIADEIAAKKENSKAAYAMLLFSEQFGAESPILTNNFFNHSLLKQRIIMLTKPRSPRKALLKYGFSLPLFMAMLIISSATLAENKVFKNVENFIKPQQNLTQEPIKAMAQQKLKTPKKAVKKMIVNDEKIYKKPEQNPEFIGGLMEMYNFLGKNIKYPQEAQEKKIAGKVFVKFIVKKDGSVADIIITKGIGYGCDEESKRVIAMMPKWNAGKEHGKSVNVEYIMPIVFQLD